jgi:putative DNA primase/helicase
VTDAKGRPIDCEANVLHILENDQEWQGVIAFDEFAARPVKLKAPPFRGGVVGPWIDLDDNELQIWITLRYDLRCNMDRIRRAVTTVASRHAFNEPRDFLDGLKWDGQLRLKCWLERYCGAGEALGLDEDAVRTLRYLRRVGVKTLVGWVARIYQPGCKLDTMTVLEGSQGLKKSTAWRVLGGKWFTDSYLDTHSKEPMAIIQGVWVVEWSELEALQRAEISAIKRFLTQSEDRYRTWYGHRAETVPRRCAFVGTVNGHDYLRDTENRRFWPVKVGDIDIEGLRRDREQLLAEAVRWYRRGVRWWVQGAERELFMEQQERRFQYDAFEDRIRAYVSPSDPNLQRRDEVTVAELLKEALGLNTDRWTRAEQQRVAQAIGRLGFERRQEREEGSWRTRRWVYRRIGVEGKRHQTSPKSPDKKD